MKTQVSAKIAELEENLCHKHRLKLTKFKQKLWIKRLDLQENQASDWWDLDESREVSLSPISNASTDEQSIQHTISSTGLTDIQQHPTEVPKVSFQEVSDCDESRHESVPTHGQNGSGDIQSISSSAVCEDTTDIKSAE